ncbi:hypothetical protein Afil01_55480 [Actinorhabdospora filicis]|uniref:RNA polymerase sigma factor 70 region 4 type 2 domain-containing protein n=1 Tax=Actinorhabdospora filicis TaxID=1785913 RepID=A0A9W6SU16_9ACTN|nr:sigma factor-like helix-turn-helix DNA-binding protein [Actinorhabdospora filicis]GLZ80741.1 hypothetical protein Afil01_55480 [Actinorhabdospora filicis]
MDDPLIRRFDETTGRLREIARTMLGSHSEAEEALHRVRDALGGPERDVDAWLSAVVARVAIDMLRERRGLLRPDPDGPGPDGTTLALLTVLATMDPGERLAFVLFEVFGLPFEDIAEALGGSPADARELAGRARRRVRGEAA